MGNYSDLPVNWQIRYTLTWAEETLLKSDWLNFKNEIPEKFSNAFLNRIICNYLRYCKNSRSMAFEEELKQFLKNPKKKRTPEVRIDPSPNRISLNADTVRSLESHLFISDNLAEFDKHKRKLIEKILDDYCALSYAEREIIYFYDQYLLIQEAIRERSAMRIEVGMLNGSVRKYDIRPYSLETDRITGYNYLTGFATDTGGKKEKTYTIRLQRICDCFNTGHPGALSAEEKDTIKKRIAERGIPYIAGQREQSCITVRLTKLGKELFLKRIHHQRPVPVSMTPDGDGCIMEFQCSEMQIKHYFLRFGADAEVLAPESLRKSFAEFYQKAAGIYSSS